MCGAEIIAGGAELHIEAVLTVVFEHCVGPFLFRCSTGVSFRLGVLIALGQMLSSENLLMVLPGEGACPAKPSPFTDSCVRNPSLKITAETVCSPGMRGTDWSGAIIIWKTHWPQRAPGSGAPCTRPA